MIRQAISCDVCGAEKKQTNHWFVAAEVSGELRMGGWSSRMRQRAGAKHLCGQTCLHKLVDEFMARVVGGRVAPVPAEPLPEVRPVVEAKPANDVRVSADTSLTSVAAHREPEPVARVASPMTASGPLPGSGEAIPFPIPPQTEEAPVYGSRRWRAEAWERERNREQREGGRRPEIVHRRGGV